MPPSAPPITVKQDEDDPDYDPFVGEEDELDGDYEDEGEDEIRLEPALPKPTTVERTTVELHGEHTS